MMIALTGCSCGGNASETNTENTVSSSEKLDKYTSSTTTSSLDNTTQVVEETVSEPNADTAVVATLDTTSGAQTATGQTTPQTNNTATTNATTGAKSGTATTNTAAATVTDSPQAAPTQETPSQVETPAAEETPAQETPATPAQETPAQETPTPTPTPAPAQMSFDEMYAYAREYAQSIGFTWDTTLNQYNSGWDAPGPVPKSQGIERIKEGIRAGLNVQAQREGTCLPINVEIYDDGGTLTYRMRICYGYAF